MDSRSCSSGSRSIPISNLTKMIKILMDQGESDKAHDLLLEFESKYVEGQELRNQALIKLMDTHDECSNKIKEKDEEISRVNKNLVEISKLKEEDLERFNCVNVKLIEVKRELEVMKSAKFLGYDISEKLRHQISENSEISENLNPNVLTVEIDRSREIEKLEGQIVELKRQLSEAETDRRKTENKAIEEVNCLNVSVQEMEKEIGRLKGEKLLDMQVLENLKSEAYLETTFTQKIKNMEREIEMLKEEKLSDAILLENLRNQAVLEKGELTQTIRDLRIRLSDAEKLKAIENEKSRQEKLKALEMCYEKYHQASKNLPPPPSMAKEVANAQADHDTPKTHTSDIILINDGDEDVSEHGRSARTLGISSTNSQGKETACEKSSQKRKQIAPVEKENDDNSQTKRQNIEVKMKPLPFSRCQENVDISSDFQPQLGYLSSLSDRDSVLSDNESCSASGINDMITHIHQLQKL